MTDRTIIVVGVDYQNDGDLAFDAAAQIAASQRNSEVHAIHVGPGAPAETALQLEVFCKQRVEELQSRKPSLWFERVAFHARAGNAAREIVQLAVDLDADLIVVGSHNRRGVKRLLLGSVSERVVQTARCAVYVARPKNNVEEGATPEIEPPCPECMATRKATNGAEVWCERHALARFRPRVHRVARGPAGHEAEPWSQSTPQV